MNAYKHHLTQPSSDVPADEFQQLDNWYSQVVDGADLRDRVAVTGFNISRGAFGSLVLDANGIDNTGSDVCANDANYLTK